MAKSHENYFHCMCHFNITEQKKRDNFYLILRPLVTYLTTSIKSVVILSAKLQDEPNSQIPLNRLEATAVSEQGS